MFSLFHCLTWSRLNKIKAKLSNSTFFAIDLLWFLCSTYNGRMKQKNIAPSLSLVFVIQHTIALKSRLLLLYCKHTAFYVYYFSFCIDAFNSINMSRPSQLEVFYFSTNWPKEWPLTFFSHHDPRLLLSGQKHGLPKKRIGLRFVYTGSKFADH